MHLLAGRFIFGWWLWFSEGGSQCLSNGTSVVSCLANVFLLSSSHLWSMILSRSWTVQYCDISLKLDMKEVDQVWPLLSYLCMCIFFSWIVAAENNEIIYWIKPLDRPDVRVVDCPWKWPASTTTKITVISRREDQRRYAPTCAQHTAAVIIVQVILTYLFPFTSL